jgi:phosphoglycolate phosphatase
LFDANGIKGILFDLDGTLIESSEDIAGAANYLRRIRGLEALSLKTVASYVGDGIEALVSRLIETNDPDQVAACVGQFKAYYHDHCVDQTRLYEDVLPTLQELKRRGYHLAVVTNKPAGISRRILQGLGVGQYFQTVVGGDSTHQKKPHHAPMHLACRELDVQPAHCAMVGDSHVDVAAGKGVAMRTVGIRDGIGDQAKLEAAGADLMLNGFKELLDQLP